MMEAIQSFDTSALLYIQDFLRTPFWNTFFVIFSRLGDGLGLRFAGPDGRGSGHGECAGKNGGQQDITDSEIWATSCSPIILSARPSFSVK